MIVEGIVGWLIDWLGTGMVDGVKTVVSGTPAEQALARAIGEGLEVTVSEVPERQRAMLRDSIDEHIREFPWPAFDREKSLRDALEMNLRAVVAPLGDPVITGTGTSFLDEISVDSQWLMEEFPRQIIRSIERVAARDGVLAPLAARLDADAIRAQLDGFQLTAAPASVNSIPRMPSHFTNREAELALVREIAESDIAGSGSFKLCLIDGMAGVGKSAFVIAAAHRLTSRYPDAQLYLDLRGYTPGQQPVRLAAALESLLRVIGVPAEQVPISEEARAALWRSRTAHMSFLLILDNSRDEEVIRSLLPGAADCMALIASRRRLIGLQDSNVVSLEPLAPVHASDFLKRMLGQSTTADDERVDETVAACGYLPLPITLVAGRLRGRKNRNLAQVVADLVSSQDGLASMHAEDRIIMTAFELSYEAVTPAAQVLLRRLAVCPAYDFDDYLAAAMIDGALLESSRLLDELAEHSLLLEAHAGRYQFHDLVRAYVRRMAFEQDSEADRMAGIRRAFSFYRRALVLAEHSLGESDGNDGISREIVRTPVLDTYERATLWFADERSNLISTAHAAIESAAVTEFPELVTSLGNQLKVSGYVDEALALYNSTLEMMRTRSDAGFESKLLLGRAEIERVTSVHREALADYQRAIGKAREASNRRVEAVALRGMAVTGRLVGNFEDALAYYAQAREICEALGDLQGMADTLRGTGRIRQFMGQYDEAMRYHEQALELSRRSGNPQGEADALRGIALVHQAMLDFSTARNYFLRALMIHTSIDHRIGQIDCLRGVADTEVEMGLFGDALEHYREAAEFAIQVSDQSGAVYIDTSIGRLYVEQGLFDQALEHLRRAGDRARDLNEKPAEAFALWRLGEALIGIGDQAGAISALTKSRDLFAEVSMPEAGQVARLVQATTDGEHR